MDESLKQIFRHPQFVGRNPTDLERTVWAYRLHRTWPGHCAAHYAIEMARRDASNGKTRFYHSRLGWNPAWQIGGNGPTLRCVERPTENGLRFVGFADKLARIGHTGWYLDSDFPDPAETARGVVYQLPARNGESVYLAGVADPWNGEDIAVFIEPETFRDERDSAMRADRLAELYAESEREHRRASRAGFRFDELADEIRDSRRACLALLREQRTARRYLGSEPLPVLCETLRERVRAYRKQIRNARAERVRLLREYGAEPGFRDVVNSDSTLAVSP